VPGDARTEHFIHELAKSPLSPPDVLEKVVAGFEQTPSGIERNAGPMGQLGTVALRNPNITSEQADRIGRASLEVPNIDSNRFTSGPFSAQFINELSDEVARGFGKEPLDTDTKYKGGRLDEKFHSDLDRFLSTKARFYGVYGVLAQMGANRNLGDDAVEALTEAAERHGIFEVLPYLAHRQNAAPMSEISQLRTLRALDSVPHPNEGFSAVPILAQAKGLAPSTVAALALHPNQDVRETLYRNKTVDPEVLAKAWPKKNQTPEEYLAHATEVGPGPKGQWQNDPYHDLARAIRDRRAYAARKAAQHLIKPWPKPLAKSETDWWPVKLREWMSQRSKDEEHQGYFFRAKNLDQARRLVQDKVIPTEPTDEILDGQAVFAHPAKDYHYHAWEKDRDAGDVLVYFETDSPPTHYDDRVYWPHDVVAGDVRVAGIRPANLQKMATVYGKSGPLRADMYPGLSPEQKWKGPAVSVNEEPDSAQVQYLKRATEVVHKLSPELHKECGGIADVVRRIGALGGVKAAMDAGAAAWPHGDKEDQGEHVWLRVGKELFDPKAHLLSLKHPKMFAKKPPYHNYRPYRPASWAKDLYDDLANVGDDPDELAAKAFHEVGPFGLSKGEQPLVKMAVLHDDPVKPRIVYRIEDDWGRGPYAAEGIGTGKVTPKRPVPTKDWQGTDEWHNHPSDVNFGFVKPEDAVEWFSAGTLGKLRQKGFKLRAVPAKKVWVSNSGRQVFFEPHESYQPGKAEIIQPKGAINWKPFQKRDLDPSLGYTISSKPHPSGLEVLAHDRNGVQVGRSLIGLSLRHGGNIPHLTYVEPEHQRKGIASAMYQHFENTTGEKVLPSDMQSEEAEKLWAQPGRKFGKSESLSRGPAFNGEKDYRPDESGDPKFPFQGGPRKEQTELSALTLPGSDLEPGEHRTALAQLGHNDRFELVLAAACFLARKRFDADKFQQGLAVYGDEVRAALHAVDLGDSEKNMRALAAVVQLQGGKARALSKSEGSQPIGIHSVQPGNERAVDFAEAVERAVRAGNVVHLKLSGKHSRGAMACRDPHSGKVFLLKPPGGKQSPAAGARDGSVSQPRREACFWHVADKVHLGGVIPHAELIIVNAQEWSAISLLGSDWKSLDEKNREKQYKGREVLTPYLSAGQIHRWALLDGILGNTDSHGQNLLVNEGGSVALIDHGAALAGPKFDPAHDTKSFIPFYLRVFAPDSDFKKKSPEERIKHMPRLGKYEDDILKKWLVEDFTPEMTEREMRVYGVDDTIIKAVLGRLQALRSVSGNLSEAVNRRWAGLESW
jgi:GNAT superfamily N-acetyltransferase